jgi:hypothetical protein
MHLTFVCFELTQYQTLTYLGRWQLFAVSNPFAALLLLSWVPLAVAESVQE